MRRKALFAILIAPLLLVLFLMQLADVQAARPLSVNQNPVADEGAGGVPLPQPLSIRIRQQIQITLPFVLFQQTPLTASLSVTGATLPAAGGSTLSGTLASAEAGSQAETAPATEAVIPGEVLSVTPTAAGNTKDDVLGVSALPVRIPGVGEEAEALTETVEASTSAEVTGVLPLIALPVQALDALMGVTSTAELTAPLPPAMFLTTLLTSTPEILPSLGLTLDLDIQVLVTNTMTSTVPATVVVRIAGMPEITMPITLAISLPPAMALVNVVPVTPTEVISIPVLGLSEEVTASEEMTATPEVTATAEPTATPEITPTGELTLSIDLTPTVPTDLAVVTFTVQLTTNVRLLPSVDAEIVRRAAPGETLAFVAKNAAGDWFLTQDGYWVAQVAIGEELPGLPVADAELVAALRAEAARATPTPTPLPTLIAVTPTVAAPTPTPVITPFVPVSVTTTTNANLRAGPGTAFDVAGNTVLGQSLLIVERNEAGDWLRLQDGRWILAALVQGAPPLASIPVFDPNATPTPAPPTPLPEATPTPVAPGTTVTTTVPATSTTTPGGTALPTATPRALSLTVDENLYLVDFDSVSSNYDRALSAVDRLVDSASGNATVLADPQWQTDMNTAIQLIRRAGQDVAGMVVPERFAAAHNSLVTAATQYNSAADRLAAGLQNNDLTQFESAFSAITLGDASLAQSAAALSAYRP